MYLKTITFLLFSQTLLFAQTGLASWYGEKFQGRTTASGELFNMYAYTAAHKTLAFGTIVTVTNLKNGQSVNVKINDRGPYKSNRIMDVSYQAAKTIGLINMGTTMVSIQEVKAKPLSPPVVASSELLTRVASEAELASMMEYALRVTNPRPEFSQTVQVQIASSTTLEGAKRFIVKEKSKGHNMGIVSAYSKAFKETRYKVVILCDSQERAKAIVNSKQYNGAYILR